MEDDGTTAPGEPAAAAPEPETLALPVPDVPPEPEPEVPAEPDQPVTDLAETLALPVPETGEDEADGEEQEAHDEGERASPRRVAIAIAVIVVLAALIVWLVLRALPR